MYEEPQQFVSFQPRYQGGEGATSGKGWSVTTCNCVTDTKQGIPSGYSKPQTQNNNMNAASYTTKFGVVCYRAMKT